MISSNQITPTLSPLFIKVFGLTGSGKTRIIQQYTEKLPHKNTTPTQGMEICYGPTLFNNYRLRLCDTSGKPDYFNFITEYSPLVEAYLFVIDQSQPLKEQADYLSSIADTIAYNNQLIYFVINKTDLASQISDVEINELERALCAKLDCASISNYKCSANDAASIKNLFSDVEESCKPLQQFRTQSALNETNTALEEVRKETTNYLNYLAPLITKEIKNKPGFTYTPAGLLNLVNTIISPNAKIGDFPKNVVQLAKEYDCIHRLQTRITTKEPAVLQLSNAQEMLRTDPTVETIGKERCIFRWVITKIAKILGISSPFESQGKNLIRLFDKKYDAICEQRSPKSSSPARTYRA